MFLIFLVLKDEKCVKLRSIGFPLRNFVMFLNIFIMRKIFLFLAVLLPFFALNINAEDKDVVKEIPVKKVPKGINERSLSPECINACYYGFLEGIQTVVSADLGVIEVTAQNCSTGEMWSDTFNSSQTNVHFLSITPSPGVYEIVYTTHSGERYEGTFYIDR